MDEAETKVTASDEERHLVLDGLLKKQATFVFDYLLETLAIFNNFWYAMSKRNLAYMTNFAHRHLILILLLHYLVKCRDHSLAI